MIGLNEAFFLTASGTTPAYQLFAGGASSQPTYSYVPNPLNADQFLATFSATGLLESSHCAYDPNYKRLIVVKSNDVGTNGSFFAVYLPYGNSLVLSGPANYQPSTDSANYGTSLYGAPIFSPDGLWVLPTWGGAIEDIRFGQWNGSYYDMGPEILTPSRQPGIRTGGFTNDNEYCYAAGRFLSVSSIFATTAVLRNIGGVWTVVTRLSPLSNAEIRGLAIAPDQLYVILGSNFGAIRRFTRTGDTLSTNTSIGATETGIVKQVMFTPNGLNLFTVSSGSAALQAWGVSGATYTRITAPTITEECNHISVSPDGTLLAVALDTAPFIRLYRLTGSGTGLTFSALPNPSPLPTASIQWVQFVIPS